MKSTAITGPWYVTFGTMLYKYTLAAYSPMYSTPSCAHTRYTQWCYTYGRPKYVLHLLHLQQSQKDTFSQNALNANQTEIRAALCRVATLQSWSNSPTFPRRFKWIFTEYRPVQQQWYTMKCMLFLGLYRISAPPPAPAGIRQFFQIRQKSGSGENPTGAG